MSRTYKEHHPTAHNPKNRIPTPYLDKEGKVERRRKRRAYGSQGWKGWGGEIYFKKYGEIMMDVVDKKKARREAKKHIENELQDCINGDKKHHQFCESHFFLLLP